MILVIGDAIVDEYEELESVRPCPEGEWPIVQVTRYWSTAGGALAVSKMVRALSEDVKKIVNHDCFEPQSSKRRIVLDGKTLYRIDRDVAGSFSDKVVMNINLIETDPSVVLLADYGKGCIDRSVVEACLDRGWRVIADPHRSTAPETFRGIYGVTPNRREDTDHHYWLRETMFPRCCLKLDQDGMKVRDERATPSVFNSTAHHPVLDVTGCGDQVLATLGVMVSRGYDWHEACRIANVAAGIKCGKRGATPVLFDELLSEVGSYGLEMTE